MSEEEVIMEVSPIKSTSSEATPTEETSSQQSTPTKMMNPSALSEEELRSVLFIMQKGLDGKSLRSVYETLEEIFPDEIETAHEVLADGGFDASVLESTASRDSITYVNSETKGCYMHYDPSSGKLKLQYSGTPVENALGFYSSRSIPNHKFKKNFGRADLIGGCFSGIQGRKNYYSGWCQFIRAARSEIKAEKRRFGETTGKLWIYPRGEDVGLDVDIYVYDTMAEYQTIQLPVNQPLQDEILEVDAVTCLPKHSDVFEEVKQMELNVWLVRANNVGATTRFTMTASPRDESPSRRQISLVDPSPKKVLPSNEEQLPVPEPPHGSEETKGCYLLYDQDSGKLKLQYSKVPVRHAIGFYCAGEGHAIRGFKYTKNFGRADLIGNCASGVSGRKNYYSGWCQFIRAARSHNGPLWIYPRTENSKGLDVDMYVYYKEPEVQRGSGGEQSKKLEPNKKLCVSEIDAVACLPKHADFFSEIKTMDIPWWLTEANKIGATSKFE